MKNVLVGQSGGPTAVINSSLAGVIFEGQKSKEIDKIYGMINGIEGFLNNNYMDLSNFFEEDIELLKTTPGAYLGSCRYKLPKEFDDSVYEELFRKFDELNIGYVLYIGGNDSMDTADKLSKYAKKVNSNINFIGVPKTIDNDLVGTDHTPGFGSAAKFVANTVRDIILDAEVYDKPSVTIIEIMGRHAGWLTAASALARRFDGDNPYMIYLPEGNFSLDNFLKKLQDNLKIHKNIVVCVSEGIKDSEGKFICEYQNEATLDNFGHKSLTGCGKFLENEVKAELGVKVRSVELNVVQRCAASLISKTDLDEAFEVGRFGVKSAINNETAKMICIIRDSNYSVSYKAIDVSEISNKEKTFPKDWILNESDISNEAFSYLKPLILGEVNIKFEDGVAKYLFRK